MIHWKDGTSFNPPENPLADKWDKLYPPCEIGRYGGWDYQCMFCNQCHYGETWKIPEEDKEVWEKYRTELDSYIDAHGGCENLVVDLNLDLIKEDEGKS